MASKVKNPHLGSSLDEFLSDEGILEEATARSLKKVLVWQIEEAMQRNGFSKAEMARMMRTSRSQLDRLLDPDNPSLTLSTLSSAAKALGKDIQITLE